MIFFSCINLIYRKLSLRTHGVFSTIFTQFSELLPHGVFRFLELLPHGVFRTITIYLELSLLTHGVISTIFTQLFVFMLKKF